MGIRGLVEKFPAPRTSRREGMVDVGGEEGQVVSLLRRGAPSLGERMGDRTGVKEGPLSEEDRRGGHCWGEEGSLPEAEGRAAGGGGGEGMPPPEERSVSSSLEERKCRSSL